MPSRFDSQSQTPAPMAASNQRDTRARPSDLRRLMAQGYASLRVERTPQTRGVAQSSRRTREAAGPAGLRSRRIRIIWSGGGSGSIADIMVQLLVYLRHSADGTVTVQTRSFPLSQVGGVGRCGKWRRGADCGCSGVDQAASKWGGHERSRLRVPEVLIQPISGDAHGINVDVLAFREATRARCHPFRPFAAR